MTDMVSPATLTWGEGRRGIHTTAQADARLRKRYAAELRFKLFGLAAVSVAILALVVLLGSILHGGGTPFDPSQYYQVKDGRMYNGLVVVAYNLHDVGPGDGGFGCVPGSHKSNYPFPSEWRDLADFKPFMRAVTGPAGTAVVFTEALTHGAMPWTGAHERRTLFLKYILISDCGGQGVTNSSQP